MEVSKAFQKILTKQGLKFKLDTKVTAAGKTTKGIRVNVEGAKDGNNETVLILFFFSYYESIVYIKLAWLGYITCMYLSKTLYKRSWSW